MTSGRPSYSKLQRVLGIPANGFRINCPCMDVHGCISKCNLNAAGPGAGRLAMALLDLPDIKSVNQMSHKMSASIIQTTRRLNGHHVLKGTKFKAQNRIGAEREV